MLSIPFVILFFNLADALDIFRPPLNINNDIISLANEEICSFNLNK